MGGHDQNLVWLIYGLSRETTPHDTGSLDTTCVCAAHSGPRIVRLLYWLACQLPEISDVPICHSLGAPRPVLLLLLLLLLPWIASANTT